MSDLPKTTKIHDLPKVSEVNDSDIFIIQSDENTNKIDGADLKAVMQQQALEATFDHTSNNEIHVTKAEKELWNGMSGGGSDFFVTKEELEEALDGIFDGTIQVGDSAKLGGKALNDIVQQEIRQVYLSPSGSDEVGDGTELNPWKTIQKAINECPASSNEYVWNVYLFNGIYEGNVNVRKVRDIRFYAVDEVTTNIVIKGTIFALHNAIIEFHAPITIDGNILLSDGANLRSPKRLTIKNNINGNALEVSTNARAVVYVLAVDNCATACYTAYNSFSYIGEIIASNCTTGIKVENGGKIAYGSASFTNVATQYVTSNGGRIYTGAQNELTTANKPTGTYTGNGSAAERQICIGDSSVDVYSTVTISSSTNDTIAIVTRDGGAICVGTNGSVTKLSKSNVSISYTESIGTVLVLLTTNACLNANGVSYRYNVS